MERCAVCGREAVYDSPRLLCELHWSMWFSGPSSEYPMGCKWTPKRWVRLVRWTMRNSWRIWPRPNDWRTQWRNVENEVYLALLGVKPL